FTSANFKLSLRNPVPGVVNTAPDFAVVLKNAAGKSFLLLNGFAAAPSHPISRRPPGCSPATVFTGSPSSARNWSIVAVSVPVAVSTGAVGVVGPGLGCGLDGAE